MRHLGMRTFVLAALVSILAASSALAQGLTLAEGGKSPFTIVLPTDAIPSERHAAEELQKFVKEVSGAELPIESDSEPLPSHAVMLGKSRLLPVKIDFEKLGKEGFVIRTAGDHLVIAGGRPRGTMYGVYQFLEDYLDCRWFSSKVSRIPKRERIELPQIDRTVVPVLESRSPFFTDAWDGDWAARNRMNSHHARLDEARGGKVVYDDIFVHTFNALVPPEKYFDEHPEYFSLIGGKRQKGYYQLCLTNPEVVAIASQTVRDWLEKKPETTIVSVSQNDTGGWCECPNCKAVEEEEGSHSGPIIRFVNQIADAIREDYPDVAIDTLAYQYSRKPPNLVRPRPNVIVRLCSIEACFSHPLETCPENASFRDDLIAWSKICDRLYVWDYVTDFSHYLLPYPNLDVLSPNIRFFVNHGVKGIFEQGSYAPGGGGEMAELRAYMLAKFLWNPDCDPEAVKREFLEGYYSGAARAIGEYLHLTHDGVKPSATNYHLRCFAPAQNPYLSRETLEKAEALFQEALEAADTDEVRQRVGVAHLPVMYARLANGFVAGNEAAETAVRFRDVAAGAGIQYLNEGGLQVGDFAKQFETQ